MNILVIAGTYHTDEVEYAICNGELPYGCNVYRVTPADIDIPSLFENYIKDKKPDIAYFDISMGIPVNIIKRIHSYAMDNSKNVVLWTPQYGISIHTVEQIKKNLEACYDGDLCITDIKLGTEFPFSKESKIRFNPIDNRFRIDVGIDVMLGIRCDAKTSMIGVGDIVCYCGELTDKNILVEVTDIKNYPKVEITDMLHKIKMYVSIMDITIPEKIEDTEKFPCVVKCGNKFELRLITKAVTLKGQDDSSTVLYGTVEGMLVEEHADAMWILAHQSGSELYKELVESLDIGEGDD